MSKHPRNSLDKELTAPLRLSIVAALAAVEKAEFSAIRDAVETNDAELSRQLTRLSNASYVEIIKSNSGRYTKTWLSITPDGKEALRTHVAALRAITS